MKLIRFYGLLPQEYEIIVKTRKKSAIGSNRKPEY
jgi:hypothetical protein